MKTPNLASLPEGDALLSQLGQPSPTGVRRWLRIGGIVLAVALVIALVIALTRPGNTAPVRYVTKPISRGDLVTTITASGTLRAKDTVSVGVEVSGRVIAVNADFNDAVHAGQVLVELDPAPLKAQLLQHQAQLASTKADLANRKATADEAKQAVQRTQSLAESGLSSKQAVEQALAASLRADASVEAARAQVEVAAANVQSTRTSLEKTVVRSPIDGFVLSRDVTVGQTLIAAMSPAIVFKVARNLEDMELTLSIDEADVGRTREGQNASFTVDAWLGRTFDATVSSIHNDAISKQDVVTYDAQLAVANPERLLRPGMTATVTVVTAQRENVMHLPNAALRFRPAAPPTPKGFGPPDEQAAVTISDSRPRVFVLKNGVPVETIVETGLSDGSVTELRSTTLLEGDAVIIDAEEVSR